MDFVILKFKILLYIINLYYFHIYYLSLIITIKINIDINIYIFVKQQARAPIMQNSFLLKTKSIPHHKMIKQMCDINTNAQLKG